MILQYLCVGLHGTACDQLFTSFLVAPIASGGLGLTADHYAMLVAIMFFFSMVWCVRMPVCDAPTRRADHLIYPQAVQVLPHRGAAEWPPESLVHVSDPHLPSLINAC